MLYRVNGIICTGLCFTRLGARLYFGGDDVDALLQLPQLVHQYLPLLEGVESDGMEFFSGEFFDGLIHWSVCL